MTSKAFDQLYANFLSDLTPVKEEFIQNIEQSVHNSRAIYDKKLIKLMENLTNEINENLKQPKPTSIEGSLKFDYFRNTNGNAIEFVEELKQLYNKLEESRNDGGKVKETICEITRNFFENMGKEQQVFIDRLKEMNVKSDMGDFLEKRSTILQELKTQHKEDADVVLADVFKKILPIQKEFISIVNSTF